MRHTSIGIRVTTIVCGILLLCAATLHAGAGVVDGGVSTVSVAPPSLPADDTLEATITITLKDANGTPLSGVSIAVAQDTGNSTISIDNNVSDANGQVFATVRSLVPETVDYTVTDTDDVITLSQVIRVAFLPLPKPAITSAPAAAGQVDSPFSFQITGTGYGALTYSSPALPPGLEIDNDIIDGYPTDAGFYNVLLVATDNFGNVGTGFLIITIAPLPAQIISPLADTAKVGTPYYYEISATGTDPFAFSAINLPPGLILDDNVISGTPETPGQFNISLVVTDDASQSDTQTLVLNIIDKKGDLPPSINDVSADTPNAVGELVSFSINMVESAAVDVSTHWDFGDGSSADGEDVTHIYTAAGTYKATATVSDGTNSSSQSIDVEIFQIDSNAPVIFGIDVSNSLPAPQENVVLTVQAQDPNGSALRCKWNFGDGANVAFGAQVNHTYTKENDFTVVLTATNAAGLTSLPFTTTIFVAAPNGESNVAEGDETDPTLNGLGIGLDKSSNGSFVFGIDVDSLNRDAFSVYTDFGLPGVSAVRGTSPAVKVNQPGIFVATTTASELKTKVIKGKARKTVPVSRRELGLPPLVSAEPKSHTLNIALMKGEFSFGAAATAGGALTRSATGLDSLSAKMSVELPAGLDMSKSQQVQIAMGNIVDTVTLDSKGRGKGRLTTFQIKHKGRKSKTEAGDMGEFTVKMLGAGMAKHGLDTEGVVPKPKTTKLKIQCAFVIGGVAYSGDMPMDMKISSSGKSAQIAGKVKP